MEIKQILLKFTQNSNLHAQWLNSLSYLEYRGLRMIIKSIKSEEMDEQILGHIMEEARHALYFKKLAIKIGGKSFIKFNSETLLSENFLKGYFYHLNENTKDHNNSYNLMSWLIEERALKVYQIYDEVLKSQGFDFNLGPILIDEIKHLEKVQSQFDGNEKLKYKLKNLEEIFFEEIWQAFSSNILNEIQQ